MHGVLIALAFLIGMWTAFLMAAILRTSSRALDGAIMAHLRLNHANYPGSWMKSGELVGLFGTIVYEYVRRLVRAGLVEVHVEPGTPGDVRGGRPTYWYRWKGDEKDPIVGRLKTF